MGRYRGEEKWGKENKKEEKIIEVKKQAQKKRVRETLGLKTRKI
jgi:hypothetical protein